MKKTTTITLKDCIAEVFKAWSNDVTSRMIAQCFRTPRTNAANVMDNILDILTDMWDLVKGRTEISEDITLDQFININKEILTTEYPTDHKIVNPVLKLRPAITKMERNKLEMKLKM